MIYPKTRHLVFDMDLTLVHVRPHTTCFIKDQLKKHGVHMSQAQIKASGRWYSKFWVDPPPFDWGDKENLTENRRTFWMQFLSNYYKILNLPKGSLDPILWEIASMIEAKNVEEYILDDDVDALAELKSMGYVLSVLSNRFKPISPVISEMGLDSFFEYAHSAGEMGDSKPNKEIFQKHLKIIKAEPDETVYIGDNYWLDVLGAESAGLPAILFDRFGWYDQTDCVRITAIADLIPMG